MGVMIRMTKEEFEKLNIFGLGNPNDALVEIIGIFITPKVVEDKF